MEVREPNFGQDDTTDCYLFHYGIFKILDGKGVLVFPSRKKFIFFASAFNMSLRLVKSFFPDNTPENDVLNSALLDACFWNLFVQGLLLVVLNHSPTS